jgi:hypothetical protein
MAVFLGRRSVPSSRPCWLNTRCRRPFPDSRQSSSWSSASERAKRSRSFAAADSRSSESTSASRSNARRRCWPRRAAAPARCSATTSACRPRGTRADAAILGCPAYTHLVYRSGVPLVDTTVIGGRLTWQAG